MENYRVGFQLEPLGLRANEEDDSSRRETVDDMGNSISM